MPFSLLENHLAYGHETEGGDGAVIIVDWKTADGIKDTGRIPRWYIPHCKAWEILLLPQSRCFVQFAFCPHRPYKSPTFSIYNWERDCPFTTSTSLLVRPTASVHPAWEGVFTRHYWAGRGSMSQPSPYVFPSGEIRLSISSGLELYGICLPPPSPAIDPQHVEAQVLVDLLAETTPEYDLELINCMYKYAIRWSYGPRKDDVDVSILQFRWPEQGKGRRLIL
ncbi:hypothetical protein FA13DRAFT_1802018 [Coprinellus micaceus]|uniref:Uncharacterized protein n=1 Tax=Coprinellus micaceus TaxID=71717 RepID=A0A4Y7SD38_COPMI|nr:hypothetical protein FA13DRAFT_1802018 [Coprinellus micaceus]